MDLEGIAAYVCLVCEVFLSLQLLVLETMDIVRHPFGLCVGLNDRELGLYPEGPFLDSQTAGINLVGNMKE